MMFQHVPLRAPHPQPHPHLILFLRARVCFYGQEVTNSQLSFLSLPLAAPVIYRPSCCLQTRRGSAFLLAFLFRCSTWFVEEGCFLFWSLCWGSGRGRGRSVVSRWARHEGVGRRSKADAGRDTWILQNAHRRDGSYSKTNKEGMLTERNREKRTGAFWGVN